MDLDPPPVEDFFAGPEGANDDYAFGGGQDGGDDYDGDAQSNGTPGPSGEGEGHVMGPEVAFDPRHEPQQRELLLAMNADDEGAMDYFDSKFRKNWAGPQHWKLQRTIRKREFFPRYD
jgi:condensin complex subunit 2